MAKPKWLRRGILASDKIAQTREILRRFSLNTVCESALCPNLCECFDRGRATFIIMGSNCTRGCKFCAVKNGNPQELDSNEPSRIYEAVRQLRLKYIVITSVTRDDLSDGGAGHYADVIKYLRKRLDDIKVEVLVSDFKGSNKSLEIIYNAKIDVFAHNVDTVRRLHKSIKPGSDYGISLNVLKRAKCISEAVPTKSGLILGLGETGEEVVQTMMDLRDANCDIITLGQYLRPAPDRLKESEFISPKLFEKYKEIAYNLKFKNVSSGPFVRSSYHIAY
ncbi:MAG: lipoyl synthase [Omnitrophica WOR_2 bacterium SM23_29]|nr:MAG: lipoyl synthase [Omnitrophica WOR_2 bacterium SM23_29]